MLDQPYLDAIKGFEGYSPNAAWDYKQSSSGYGTRAQPGDENIPQDQLKAVHEQRFQDEIGKAASSVDQFAPNLPQGVRAALTSLTYNAGPGWQQSGLGQAIKSGDLEAARGIFPQYNKAGGEVNPGLVARRAQELAWWGGQPATPAPGVSNNTPASPAAPANGLLAMARGLLPQAPSGGLMAQPQGADQSGLLSQEAPKPPQIFYAPRKAPDLRALQAALQRAPSFPRG